MPCGVETRVVIDEGGMDDYDCSQVPEAPRTHDTSPACARGKADSGPGVAGDGTRQEVGADEKSSNSEAPVFAVGQAVEVKDWPSDANRAIVKSNENAPFCYLVEHKGMTYAVGGDKLTVVRGTFRHDAEDSDTSSMCARRVCEGASLPKENSRVLARAPAASKPEAFVIGQEVVVKIWPSGSNRAVVTSDRDAPFCYVVRYEGTTYPMKGEELAPLLDDAEENHPCESGPSAATEEAEAPAPANADECMEDSEADSAGAKSSSSEAPVFAVGQEVEVKFWPRGANRAVVTSNTNAPFCYVVTHKGTTHSVDGPQLKEVKPPRSSKAQSVSKGKKAKAATKQRAEAPADDEKSSNSEAPVFAVGQAVEVKIWPSNANRGVVTSNESAPFCYRVEHKGKAYTVTEEQLTVVKDSCPSKAKSASKHVKNEAPRFEVGQKVRVVGWSPDDVLTVTCNKKYPKYVVTTSAGAQHVKTEDQLARCETESQWTDGEECPEEDAVYRVGQKVKVHRKGWGCEFHKVVGTDRAPAVYRVRHEKTRNKRDVVAAEISTDTPASAQGTKRTLDAPPTTPKRVRYEHSESSVSDDSESSAATEEALARVPAKDERREDLLAEVTATRSSKAKSASKCKAKAAKHNAGEARRQVAALVTDVSKMTRVAKVAAQWQRKARDITVLAQEVEDADEAAKRHLLSAAKLQREAQQKQARVQELMTRFQDELLMDCA